MLIYENDADTSPAASALYTDIVPFSEIRRIPICSPSLLRISGKSYCAKGAAAMVPIVTHPVVLLVKPTDPDITFPLFFTRLVDSVMVSSICTSVTFMLEKT